MNEQQKALVLATVPVLRESGVALTAHFYQRMLAGNPELKNVFNQAHQQLGHQQQALAAAVLAYAENIHDPSVLLPVVERIAHKHTSLGIRAEQYAIVGKHLLASINEVLGEAASDELIDAWGAAYQQLAALFIGVESDLYQQATDQRRGWTGWRPFRICRKVAESAEITSFYLEPNDGGPLPDFNAGQYISVRVLVPQTGVYQPRQYSLSQAPGQDALRISVKKHSACGASPQGVVSTLLHDEYHQGAVVDLSAPFGEFFIDQHSTRPVVLISGGVGITPMIAISELLMQSESARSIHFVHSARNPKVHAFKAYTDQLAEQGVRVHYHYDESGATPLALSDVLGADGHDADYYLCGPRGFMQHYIRELGRLGVAPSQIHAEAFGTGGVA